MDNSKRILLFTDTRRIHAQAEFNEELKPHLLAVLTSFNKLGIGELDSIDLAQLHNGTPKPILLKKASSKFKDVEFNGVKGNPERILDMTVDASQFIKEFNECQKFVRESIQNKSTSESIGLYFLMKFFIVGSSSIELDDHFFADWCDRDCRKYTRNEIQNELVANLTKICDGFNSMQSKNLVPPRTPLKWIADESVLGEFIKWNGNKVEINFAFILRH